MVKLDGGTYCGVPFRDYGLFWFSVCYSCLVLWIRFYLGLWRLSLREYTYFRCRYIDIYIYRYIYCSVYVFGDLRV